MLFMLSLVSSWELLLKRISSFSTHYSWASCLCVVRVYVCIFCRHHHHHRHHQTNRNDDGFKKMGWTRMGWRWRDANVFVGPHSSLEVKDVEHVDSSDKHVLKICCHRRRIGHTCICGHTKESDALGHVSYVVALTLISNFVTRTCTRLVYSFPGETDKTHINAWKLLFVSDS